MVQTTLGTLTQTHMCVVNFQMGKWIELQSSTVFCSQRKKFNPSFMA